MEGILASALLTDSCVWMGRSYTGYIIYKTDRKLVTSAGEDVRSRSTIGLATLIGLCSVSCSSLGSSMTFVGLPQRPCRQSGATGFKCHTTGFCSVRTIPFT